MEEKKQPFGGASFEKAQDKQGKEKIKHTEIEELQKKCDEYLNNWKRSTADFINYKKGEGERSEMIVQYTKEDLLLNLLPIFDHIELAEKQLPENLKKGVEGTRDAIEWTKGFMQIQNQVKEFLKKEGIKEIKTHEQKFDPSYMEAIAQTYGDGESGTVTEELQKGYMRGEKVLRPAKVKIIK